MTAGGRSRAPSPSSPSCPATAGRSDAQIIDPVLVDNEASTGPQNSSNVCPSRPFRASRDASIETNAPTRPGRSQQGAIKARTRVRPDTETAQIIVDDHDLVNPSERAGADRRARTVAAGSHDCWELVDRGLANVD